MSADERKTKNLKENNRCVPATGCGSLDEGLDLVVGGKAGRVGDERELQEVAHAYHAGFGDRRPFEGRMARSSTRATWRSSSRPAGEGPWDLGKVVPVKRVGVSRVRGRGEVKA